MRRVNQSFGFTAGLGEIGGIGKLSPRSSGSSGGLVVRSKSRHDVITANMSIQAD